MSSKRILLIASGLLIIIPSLFLLPSRAYATTIVLNPSSGAVGSQITVTGDGFVGKSAWALSERLFRVMPLPARNGKPLTYIEGETMSPTVAGL